MARWFVEYYPYLSGPSDLVDRPALAGIFEIPCYRIFPEGERERWIAETNPDLPREVQEELAFLIADALSNLLGI
jgi:hypothetical protein